MPRIRFALGVSAENAALYDDDVESSIREVVRSRRASVVAIGRCGLGERSTESEEQVFKRQAALAREFDLPLIIGATGAWAHALKVLKAAGLPERGVLLSGFDGTPEELEAWREAGAFVSLDVRVANDPDRFSPLAQIVPADRLLVESGAPRWTLNDLPGAEPRADQIVFVAAALKDRVDPHTLSENFKALFS